MQAMLLAAGLGTRLRPLTELLPKPVVPVANRPLGAFAMEHLARAGVHTIVANTHPQPALVEQILCRCAPKTAKLRFSREQTLLGTGGGLRKAWPLFPDRTAPVIVVNGDTLFAPELGRALRRHVETGAVATMILRRTPHPERLGAVGIDGAGWVKSLLGAPAGLRGVESLMFTGVHIFAPEAFDAMPESGCVIRSAYRGWVDAGAPVLGIVDDSPWADLGTVSDYHRVNLQLARGSFPWPGIQPVDGNLIADDSVDPTSRSKIRGSVVGADVTMASGVSIERCVVWSESVIRRSEAGAVITPKHRIVVS